MFWIAALAATASDAGVSRFDFTGWAGPPIPVRLYVPANDERRAPVVIVMHGASRDAERYFDDWAAEAERRDLVVVVPEFTVEDFPRSARYNLGHVFDPVTGSARDEALWTFSAIEPLFDDVVRRIGGAQTEYTLYGHSAGSQFVHRFLYYKPDARAARYIAANAGWYTVPLFDVEYPYGLRNAGVDETRLPDVLASDLTILLGTADNDPEGASLRKTPEAELQGAHRFERGLTMYRVAKAVADELEVDFNWRLEFVDGADHDNAKMTPAAAAHVFRGELEPNEP